MVGVMGIGLTCVFSMGELDFSAGTQVSIATCLMAVVLSGDLVNSYILGMIITLSILGVIGLYNAFLNIKIGIPAFIATLGTSYLVKGFAKAMTKGLPLNNLAAWPEVFTFIGQGYLFGIIPMPVVVFVMVSLLGIVYTDFTRNGKYMYAVGSNKKACEYMGISVEKQKLKGFIITAVLCGLAGIMEGSMMNASSPTLGESMFVPALTTIFLGATYGKIGVFNVPGTIVGALLYALINQGLIMITTELSIKFFVQGGMLLFALVIVTSIKNKDR
jgi:ribose/xylose/arabinose/galactoside ABC-type transport system permease subunit